MRRIVSVLGWLLGLYLVVRAIAEPFVIDVADPATYATDWGGPSLIGVLLVHIVPGALAAILMIRAFMRRGSSSDPAATD